MEIDGLFPNLSYSDFYLPLLYQWLHELISQIVL